MQAVVKEPPDLHVAPTIMEARKLIESCGWVRGELCTDHGYCIMGALITVQKDMEVQDLALEHIRNECGAKFVTWWNDETAETKKEVLKMLERAAKRARAILTPRREPEFAGPERGSIYS